MRTGWIIAVLAGVSLGLGPAAAEERRVLYVFDASGSMALPFVGPDGREGSRIEAAKRQVRAGMSAQLRDDPSTKLGLLVFGLHGGCSDPDRLVEPSSAGLRAQVDGELQKLEPTGDTPLALSIKRGGEYLASLGGGELVVVTDGADSCGGDPIAEAGALQKSHGIKTSLIAIDPRSSAEGMFEAIAKAGGGTFRSERPSGVPDGSLRSIPLPAQLDGGTYLSIFPAPSSMPSPSAPLSAQPSSQPSSAPSDGPLVDPESIPKEINFGAPKPSPKPVEKPKARPSAEPEMGPLPLL